MTCVQSITPIHSGWQLRQPLPQESSSYDFPSPRYDFFLQRDTRLKQKSICAKCLLLFGFCAGYKPRRERRRWLGNIKNAFRFENVAGPKKCWGTEASGRLCALAHGGHSMFIFGCFSSYLPGGGENHQDCMECRP